MDKTKASKAKQMIAQRSKQIPRAYKAVYRKAVQGNSLRAAVNAQCLECCCWHITEIRNCTDLACPLYAVRPYQSPQKDRHKRSKAEKSTKTNKGEYYVTSRKLAKSK